MKVRSCFHLLLSIPSNRLTFGLDTRLVNEDHLDIITSINISLSDGVNGVLGRVLSCLPVLSELGVQVVVALELIVEHGAAELLACTLHTDYDLVITADGILASSI